MMPEEQVAQEAPAQEEPPALGLLGPRSRHLLALEFGDRRDFDDPRQEWRRLFSELLGTFMLVLVAAGGGILHGEGQIGPAAAVVAPGLMVMAIILFMGAVSGAHLNPVVSARAGTRARHRCRREPHPPAPPTHTRRTAARTRNRLHAGQSPHDRRQAQPR
jgi:aquaporin Z